MREVRFGKFKMNRWLNGDEHWLIMGQDYEDWESPEDIVKKIRNAAWYRATTARIVVYPDRIWVKANEPGQGTHRPSKPHVSLEDRVKILEDKIRELNTLVEDVINGS